MVIFTQTEHSRLLHLRCAAKSLVTGSGEYVARTQAFPESGYQGNNRRLVAVSAPLLNPEPNGIPSTAHDAGFFYFLQRNERHFEYGHGIVAQHDLEVAHCLAF